MEVAVAHTALGAVEGQHIGLVADDRGLHKRGLVGVGLVARARGRIGGLQPVGGRQAGR
jgi:hypothetical protein